MNITKPVVINANSDKWSMINADKISVDGIDDFVSFLRENGASVWREKGTNRTSTADIVSAIEDAIDEEMIEADGIIIENVYDDGGYGDYNTSHLGTDYVIFNSNQAKNTDNLNPTENEDIRYSNRILEDYEQLSAFTLNEHSIVFREKEKLEKIKDYEYGEIVSTIVYADDGKSKIVIFEGAIDRTLNYKSVYEISGLEYNEIEDFKNTLTLLEENGYAEDFIFETLRGYEQSTQGVFKKYLREANKYISDREWASKYRKQYLRSLAKGKHNRKRSAYSNGRYSDRDAGYRNSVNRLASEYLNGYSGTEKKEIRAKLKELAAYINAERMAEDSSDFEFIRNSESEILDYLAEELVNNHIVEEDDNLKAIKKYLRETQIKVDSDTKSDIGYRYDGWNNFRKRNMGRLSLSENGIDVDTAYQELNDYSNCN